MNRMSKNKTLEDLYYSFPAQLLINHFKKNQILLLLWFILFGFVTSNIGNILGIPYLFLDPEYMNKVNYKGFLIIGVAVGIFILSFHITTYILDSYRFNFLGTVARPFTKFCLNNSIIPLAFLIVYSINIVRFQFKSGFQTNSQIFLEVASFLLGVFVTLFLLLFYFRSTNKDIFKELASNLDRQLKKTNINRVNVLRKLKSAKKNKYIVNHYLDFPCRFVKVEPYRNYDKEILLKVFDQNHLNAVIVEIFVIIVIIILGLFRDNSYFQIPAAASGILFFSIFIMFTGAFSYWLRGWAITALVAALVIFNFLVKFDIINSKYQAYGINYNNSPAEYSLERLNALSSDSNFKSDTDSTTQILNNWRNKFSGPEKPKMVFICVSGGGQRAAAWTTRTLQYVDSTLNGGLIDHSILMTGASGGMVGASYFRELYLRKKQGENIDLYSDHAFTNITKDVLNPVIFSLVVNDIFFRFQKFNYGNYEYLKDRGYAFEEQLNTNLNHVLDKKVCDYKTPEHNALIPLIIMSPTVINDGRKLFISSQHCSYMTTSPPEEADLNQKIKGIEFQRFYEEQDSKNLRFLSAMRMSATFPYVTPNVELPSIPSMEIMDAGIADNFGIRDAVRFLYVFREWISKNTSGVVFVCIRDSQKDSPIEKKAEASIFQKMFTPIGSLYNNWDYLQDFNNDNLIEGAYGWFDGKINVVNFEYIPKPRYWGILKEKKINPEEVEKKEIGERAVLSWHLTTREKQSLKRTILENNNQESLNHLKKLLSDQK
ncbi:MAG: patatin-like phospholipase family protein [Sporocytophaga sp.]|nr:patatin-like phospholipase family protein [Sporocytophaga sp.]